VLLATFVTLVASMFATTFFVNRQLDGLRELDFGKLTMQAETKLAEGGLDGLREWVRQAESEHPGIYLYVVDAQGNDVLERVLPPHLQEFVTRFDRLGHVGRQPQRAFGAAPQVLDPDGRLYTILPSYVGRQVLGASETLILLYTLPLLLAAAVSTFTYWLVARNVTAPITKLQANVRALAAGDIDVRMGEEFAKRTDELGVLARDFDQMAGRINFLIATKETAMRGMSHELRSPLARLRLALGLARRDGADVQRQLDRIELETERLDVLVRGMLYFSTLREQPPRSTGDQVELTSLVTEVVEDARLEASAAGKEVAWEPPPEVHVAGDHGSIRSAIENVLRNAVRFTAPGTAVQTTLAQEGEKVILEVRDRGPGVPDPDLTRIFEPFYRSEQPRDGDSGGIGLGLAITDLIIKLHGGKVMASNVPDGGLCMRITLPSYRSVRKAQGQRKTAAD
jgi:two-component system sensor histidine kinase CpxA